MNDHSLYFLPASFENRVRLLAAELHGRKGSIQLREIKTAAGRLAEQARCAGAERWQAVQLEDYFKRAVHDRLNELDCLSRGHSRVLSFERKAIAGGAS